VKDFQRKKKQKEDPVALSEKKKKEA